MYKAHCICRDDRRIRDQPFPSANNQLPVLACVATEYGSQSLEAGKFLSARTGRKRLDEQEMTEPFFRENCRSWFWMRPIRMRRR